MMMGCAIVTRVHFASLLLVGGVCWVAYASADVTTGAKPKPVGPRASALKPQPKPTVSAKPAPAPDAGAQEEEPAYLSIPRPVTGTSSFEPMEVTDRYAPAIPKVRDPLPKTPKIPKILDHTPKPMPTFAPLPVPTAPSTDKILDDRALPLAPREVTTDDAIGAVVALGTPPIWRCSGTLVAPDVVLTARHCVPSTTVALGEDVRQPRASAKIIATARHPSLDVALVRLEKRLTTSRVPFRGVADIAIPAGFVRLVGFGANTLDGRTGVGTKRMTDVNVFGWGCDAGRAEETGCSVGDELVIPRRGGKDTCDGDSGGPVFEHTGTGFRLVAVTSRPVRGFTTRCSDGGIYVRVDRIATWLTATLAQWKD